MRQSIYLRIQFSDKMEDINCTTENRQRRTDAARAVPESSEDDRDSTVYSLHRKRCDPRLRTRRWKRLVKSKIFSIRPPELGTSNVSDTRFERSSLPPRSSSNGGSGGSLKQTGLVRGAHTLTEEAQTHVRVCLLSSCLIADGHFIPSLDLAASTHSQSAPRQRARLCFKRCQIRLSSILSLQSKSHHLAPTP